MAEWSKQRLNYRIGCLESGLECFELVIDHLLPFQKTQPCNLSMISVGSACLQNNFTPLNPMFYYHVDAPDYTMRTVLSFIHVNSISVEE
jgi:hypothetical protein